MVRWGDGGMGSGKNVGGALEMRKLLVGGGLLVFGGKEVRVFRGFSGTFRGFGRVNGAAWGQFLWVSKIRRERRAIWEGVRAVTVCASGG